jgi:hypothetical protein
MHTQQQQHNYGLQPYRGPASRKRCPQCGKPNEFALYINLSNGDPIDETCGRCNRENGCGYHLTPGEFFKQNPERNKAEARNGQLIGSQRHFSAPEPEKPIDFIPLELVEQSVKAYEHNNFYKFLHSLFGPVVATDRVKVYLIGSSHRVLWKDATVFWQIDTEGRARQAKLMLYNPDTGKRLKAGNAALIHTASNFWRVMKAARPEDWQHLMTGNQQGDYSEIELFEDAAKVYGRYLSAETRNLNLRPCFFGEHLLAEYPRAVVNICESEKTAILASVYFPAPEFVWIAAGASNGVRWNEQATFEVLRNRKVILWPDLGFANREKTMTFFDKWAERAERISAVMPCTIRVSNFLETKATPERIAAGYDFADYLLGQHTPGSMALTEAPHQYPVIWDHAGPEFINEITSQIQSITNLST